MFGKIVFGKLGEFAATLTKGAHIEVEGSFNSRERTSETRDGASIIRTVSIKDPSTIDPEADRVGGRQPV